MSKKETKAYSDFNLVRTSTANLADHIKATIQAESCIAVFGRRGTGKTQISKQVIDEIDAEEVYLNLSVLERVDLGGYPKLMGVDSTESYVRYLLPIFYEKMVSFNRPVVLLLDEVDKCDPSLNAPLLELVQFRSINGRRLENLKSVIMTGNLTAEGGQRPSLPLLDRAEKFLAETTVVDWLNWAGSKKGVIHPSITAFIHEKPAELFGDVDPGEVYADPSPRGWHNASKLLFIGEEKNWSDKIMQEKVQACVGKASGIQYEVFFKHYRHVLPIVDQVTSAKPVKGWDKLQPGEKMVATMLMCNRVSREIDEPTDKTKKALGKLLDNVGDFLVKSVEPEMSLISLRSQIGMQRVIDANMLTHEKWDSILDRLVNNV